MKYAGIGSRGVFEYAPKQVDLIVSIGEIMAMMNYTLRSGGADGADKLFEEGCKLQGGLKEIFYVDKWNTNTSSGSASKVQIFGYEPKLLNEAGRIAKEYHPNWKACSVYARKLHTRNVFQILGSDLQTPTDFVVCTTSDGGATGGTGQAIRIAQAYRIPIYNLTNESDVQDLFKVFRIQKEI